MDQEETTLKQLYQYFEHATKTWRNSTCRIDFLDIIDQNKPSEGWLFDKIVCLGTGSFCTRLRRNPERPSVPLREPGCEAHQMLQFALVVDLAEELEKRGHVGRSGVQVYAQDPVYKLTDVELISSKGVTVLEMQKPFAKDMDVAKRHMGPHTLLFEFAVPKPSQMCRDLYETEIGMQVGQGSQSLRLTASMSEGVRARSNLESAEWHLEMAERFDRRYTSCEVPRFEEDWHVFQYSRIYWPKSQE